MARVFVREMRGILSVGIRPFPLRTRGRGARLVQRGFEPRGELGVSHPQVDDAHPVLVRVNLVEFVEAFQNLNAKATIQAEDQAMPPSRNPP